MDLNLGRTGFLFVWLLTRYRGVFSLPSSFGHRTEATAAAGLNGRAERILRVPLAHLKDRKGHGLSHAKTGVFRLAPLSQPRVECGGEPADFWQVQQPSWAWAQLHAGSDRGGGT